MRSRVYWLILSIALLTGGVSATGAAAQDAKTAAPAGKISLHTLDGDVQQVNIDEIWRVRGPSGRDEPAGAVIVDYAFERIFVKGPLESVINDIGSQRKIVKFTSPSGAPIYILPEKVIGISRALPYQHHENSKSIISAREGQQQVREPRDSVRDALGK